MDYFFKANLEVIPECVIVLVIKHFKAAPLYFYHVNFKKWGALLRHPISSIGNKFMLINSSGHPINKPIKRVRSCTLNIILPDMSMSWASSLKSLMVNNSANILTYTFRKSGTGIIGWVACSYGLGKIN